MAFIVKFRRLGHRGDNPENLDYRGVLVWNVGKTPVRGTVANIRGVAGMENA